MKLDDYQRQEIDSITEEYANAPTEEAARKAMKTLRTFLGLIEAPKELRDDLTTAAKIARLAQKMGSKAQP